MEQTLTKTAFQKYYGYKDSELEWLGDIPLKWGLLPAKRYHKVLKQPNAKRTCNNVLSLTLRGVVNNNLDNPEGLVPKDYATYQIFQKDDLVFKLIDLENIRTSRVGLVHEKGIMSSAYIRLITGENCDSKYVYYYYYSLYKNEVFNKLGSGVRSTLGPTDLLNLPFLNPSLEEQTAIANFLDEKTTKIDRAIALKEKMIVLLKERKQIIIQNAVTKGLDPNVKLKDSGVEWIGEIPKHWEVKRLKFLLNEFNVRSTTGIEELLSLSKYKGVIPKSSIEERSGGAESLIGYKIVKPRQLVINKMQAVNGLLAVSRIHGITSPDYGVYYSKKENRLDVDYLEHLLLQVDYLAEFKRRVTGVMEGFIRLYTDDLFGISIHLPPVEEQTSIIQHIKTISDKIEHSISIQEKQIEKFNEYKATLIDSAVTGKIKITDYGKQN